MTWDPAARTLSRTERPGYGEVVFTQVTLTLTTLTLPPTLTLTLNLSLTLTLTLTRRHLLGQLPEGRSQVRPPGLLAPPRAARGGRHARDARQLLANRLR